MSARIQHRHRRRRVSKATAPEAIFRILLTAVHGAAAMRLCDRMEQGQDADALARDTLEAALQASESALFRDKARNDRHDS